MSEHYKVHIDLYTGKDNDNIESCTLRVIYENESKGNFCYLFHKDDFKYDETDQSLYLEKFEKSDNLIYAKYSSSEQNIRFHVTMPPSYTYEETVKIHNSFMKEMVPGKYSGHIPEYIESYNTYHFEADDEFDYIN
ncbi:MAG: hypothetical protein J0H68_09890 [Sphingobacteriia bacterium]|nr:hypothetical protein [Sphingobacteriia bacterium]